MSKRKMARFARAAHHQFLRAARESSRAHLKGCVEALVFAAPEPMTMRDLARATGGRRRDIETVLVDLEADYADRGIQLVATAKGFAFLTHPAYGDEVRAVTGKKPVRMTRAQLETLAVIAYRQPVTRPEIDEVRGVDSGPVLRTLLDRELIKVLGKKEEPGRPLLYGTTDAFLELTSLTTLGDLPTLREFTELSDESRDTYERKLGERAPVGDVVFDDDPDDESLPPDDDETETESEAEADSEAEAEADSEAEAEADSEAEAETDTESESDTETDTDTESEAEAEAEAESESESESETETETETEAKAESDSESEAKAKAESEAESESDSEEEDEGMEDDDLSDEEDLDDPSEDAPPSNDGLEDLDDDDSDDDEE